VERQLERAAGGVHYRKRGDDSAVSRATSLGRGRPCGGPGARRPGEEEEQWARLELQEQDPAAAPREGAGVIPSPAA
jgi:hypothetical protein